MEAVFERRPCHSVTSGFAAAKLRIPLSSGLRRHHRHAEVTQIVFDPARISFDKLLKRLLAGARPHQRSTAKARMKVHSTAPSSSTMMRNNGCWRKSQSSLRRMISGSPIVTEIVPFKKFYPLRIIIRVTMTPIPTRATVRSSSRPSWRSWSTRKSSNPHRRLSDHFAGTAVLAPRAIYIHPR